MSSKINILYLRLSVDDDQSGESNSVTNQRRLLEEYAERNAFTPYISISDDGYSGTNYNRPGWQELMTHIEADEVSTVLVKSLDRMGRNYLQNGLYREMFKERGVRLIAVNDGVDTSKGDDDFLPFREIMAEWYARDTSLKIKSVLARKGKDGKPLSTKPPYGFYKDPNNKNQWLVDEFAASVVRRIFNLTIEGKGTFEICRILHDDKIETPAYYQTKQGYVNYSKALEASDPFKWGMHSISFILQRPEYCGHTVNFRSVKPSFKSKKQVQLPKEEWLIFENTHPAIISQQTFDLVQKLRETVRRIDTTGEANPLTGLLYCHDCGKRLYNHRSIHKISHYTCSGYTGGRQKFQEEHCTPHYVTVTALEEILLDVIHKTTGFVREHEEEFVNMLLQSSTLKQGDIVKTHSKQISKNERRIKELDKLFTNLYEDKVNGVISAERFLQMSGGYEHEQLELREKNATLQMELNDFNADGNRANDFIQLVRRYTRFEELTPQIINEFVEKIVIHESVWSEQTETDRRKGTRSQEIDVYLKYIGNFSTPDIRSPEEIETGRIAEEKLQRQRAWKRNYERRKREERRAEKTKEIPKLSVM